MGENHTRVIAAPTEKNYQVYWNKNMLNIYITQELLTNSQYHQKKSNWTSICRIPDTGYGEEEEVCETMECVKLILRRSKM